MSLSCSCSEWDGDGWFYIAPDDFTTLKTKRRKRCSSCNKLIDLGAVCCEFERYRGPITDIEERIHGGEIQIASYFMCEECSEIFLNLTALDYCIDITQDMREDLKEYHLITGFVPENK